MPSWTASLVVATLGWLLWLGAALTADQENSGAPEVFAVFFGWAFALLWFAPWLLGFGVVNLVRNRYARRNV